MVATQHMKQPPRSPQGLILGSGQVNIDLITMDSVKFRVAIPAADPPDNIVDDT